ncbi:MAG: NmrA/HSCARG family protein [Gammaproteobacteria bacterium]|nr:NmrA/HSCARG family protein [Gammaproteobacteria bacterium]MDH3466423.1 NmrA/HSCARG family protein [Gammaproteobacteria bacterium]
MRIIALYIIVITAAVGCGVTAEDAPNNQENRIILVSGITGTQGGAVARELLKRGYIVRGLTRNTKSERAQVMSKLGAQMVQGDFDDAMTLAAAMNDVYGVFVVTNYWEHGYDTEIRQGKQLIEAALSANIQHFVFTSVAGADADSGIPHFESKSRIESHLRNSGMNYSIVRPVEFMDNVRFRRDTILSGEYFDPRDGRKSHQWIASQDIGFFVGEAFDNPHEWVGRTLEVAGDRLTIFEFVDVLSRSTGVDVKHRQLTWSEYEKQNGAEMTAMMRWFDETGYAVDISALRSQYPNLLTYQQYLRGLDWD